MARILLSAAMNRPWSPGYSLAPALMRSGHEIEIFDYKSSDNPNQELLDNVSTFKPALHIAYGGEAFTYDVIRSVRQLGTINVMWYPDVTPAPIPEIIQLGSAYDVFLTMAEGLVDVFRKAGIQNTDWLAEGFEPSIYKYDRITDQERTLYSCDVTLVGKLESDNPSYMERWKLVKRIVDENINFKWWGPRIRRKIGTFVLGLLLSKVSRAYGGRFVWNETYAKAIHLSKIFIARDAYPQVNMSMSARAFTALGLGAFYLTYPTKGMEQLFTPGKELVTFETPDEMVEKIKYYLAHDDERKSIAQAGQARALAEHTYEHRFRRMFDILTARGINLE